jgi:hypothetical protein
VAIGVVSPDSAGRAEASVVGDRGGEDGKQEEPRRYLCIRSRMPLGRGGSSSAEACPVSGA